MKNLPQLCRLGIEEFERSNMVDVNALKTNQALIISLVVTAFVLGTERDGAWLLALVAVSLAIGTIVPGKGPFQLLYRRVLNPLGIVKPNRVHDQAEPHRFAQGVGALCLAVSTLFLLTGVTSLGWIVAWLVAVLALVNLVFGFCAGCFVYLHLQRLRARSGVA
jgi:hypothetical protein